MKKIIFLLIPLFAALSATADNYFTMGTNDIVRIHPMFLGNGYTIPVNAHFDGRLDYWHLTMTYPSGLSFSSDSIGPGMHVPFVNRCGADTVLIADLATLQNNTVILSSITTLGYHDPDGDGNYDTYGTVKWEAGDYDEMFSIMFYVNNTFRSGTITIDGLLSSTHDWRGNTIGPGVTFFKTVTVYVGYRLGDFDGNEILNLTDVTMLISYVLNPDGGLFDEFQQAVADVNGDGTLNIGDVTALTSMVLSGQDSTSLIDELMEGITDGGDDI